MKAFAYLIFIVLLTSKGVAQVRLKFSTYYNNHPVVFKLLIPEKFALVQGRDDNQNKEKQAHLKDGSVIYITDDLKKGGGIVDYKIEKYGNHYPLNHYITNDTATLKGTHGGKYWLEIKYFNIVAGYYNATKDDTAKYDRIIECIIPQMDKYVQGNNLNNLNRNPNPEINNQTRACPATCAKRWNLYFYSDGL